MILFGSHAYGNPKDDSDIDLIIVAPLDTSPSTYRENMDLYLHYNQFIKGFRKIILIDLIVYTRATFERFVELNSMFSREITNRGITLYENNNKGVV